MHTHNFLIDPFGFLFLLPQTEQEEKKTSLKINAPVSPLPTLTLFVLLTENKATSLFTVTLNF